MNSGSKGAATTLELLIVSALLLFFIMAPVAYYVITVNSMSAASVFNSALQAVSVRGGYDGNVQEQLYSNLIARGLIEADSVSDAIAADDARPNGQKLVSVTCSSDLTSGGTPVYRTYDAGDDSGISLSISVRQSGPRNFLSAVMKLVGVHDRAADGYLTITGYTMSQRPRPA